MTLIRSSLRSKSLSVVVIDAHNQSYTRYEGRTKTHKAYSKDGLLDLDGVMDFLTSPPDEFAVSTNPEAA